MKKDERYNYVRYLFEKGEIKTFDDIFKVLPKTVLSQDMGVGSKRFRELMHNLQWLTLKEIFIMAHFFQIKEGVMLRLILQQYLSNKKKKQVKI